MAFGLIIIGDEILSGKRQDAHFSKVVSLLQSRGLQLSWAEYIGDDPLRITATLRRTLATDDIVFCCGGIGATPDDHTRQCAAAALNLPLLLHPEAKQKIQDRLRETALKDGIELDLQSADNLQRLKMGEFPRGAEIIENPFNKIPGFSVANNAADVGNSGMSNSRHYFVPGFPVMAGPMIEAVLDQHYAHLFHQHVKQEKSVFVYEIAESTLTPIMEAIESKFLEVKVFSLPSVGDANTRRHVELGVKGGSEQVLLAFNEMQKRLDEINAPYELSLH